MVGSLNKVTLIGNLGKDPEIRSMQDGKEIATFSLATSEVWKDKVSGERREKTEWHRVVIFSQPLVLIIKNYLKRGKGSKVYLEGAIHTRKWNDQSGVEKYTTEVVLQNYNSVLMILDSKGNTAANHDASAHEGGALDPQNRGSVAANMPSYNQTEAKAPANAVEELDDEIPF